MGGNATSARFQLNLSVRSNNKSGPVQATAPKRAVLSGMISWNRVLGRTHDFSDLLPLNTLILPWRP